MARVLYNSNYLDYMLPFSPQNPNDTVDDLNDVFIDKREIEGILPLNFSFSMAGGL